MAGIGEDFARAVATKDAAAFDRLLAADVDFRGLTPGRSWEATGPGGVAAVFFDSWFEPSDTIEALVEVATGDDVADTQHVSYRLHLFNDTGGEQVAEQQAYFRTTDGRITHLRVLCSGFRSRANVGADA